jgi:xylulokinase
MPATYLGIDLGTSAVKVLALSENGQVLAKARRGYDTHAPEIGWSEQPPNDWWMATAAATGEVTAQIGDGSIAGIGLSGQLNGFVLLDEKDRPLQKAIIWLDRRATAETNELARGVGGTIEAVSGNRVSPISVMAKLLWMKRHRPDVLAKTKRLLLVKDYVLWRLTGSSVTDPSDASATNLMDLKSQRWSLELCEAVGLDPGLLPPIRPSTDVAGRVTRLASLETRIPEGTPVVPGGGDVAALALGCGVISDGLVGVTLGTAGHVVVSSKKPLPRLGNGLWQIPHMVDDRIIWLGLIMAGGLSLSWLHRIACLGPSHPLFEDFVALADRAEPGARGLIFLPFLEGAVTPYERPNARASFIGLTSSHGPAEMIRAVMEGVAFNLRQCVELFEEMGVSVSGVRLAEGGSRVSLWCQIIADVLGKPVSLIEESDTSALGAAVAAQAAATNEPLSSIAARAVQIGRGYQPSHTTNITAAYRRYCELADRHAVDQL